MPVKQRLLKPELLILFNYPLCRFHEVEEIDPSILTRLLNTQHNEMIIEALLGIHLLGTLSVFREGLDRIFGVVVVPWHVVMSKELKESLLILDQSFLIVRGDLGLVFTCINPFIEFL